MKLNKYIELTNIKPNANCKDIRTLCNLAAEVNPRSVVVNPEWVYMTREKLAKLGKKNIKVVQVYAFPTSRSTLLDGDEVDVFVKVKGCGRNKSTRSMAEGMIGLILENLTKQGVKLSNIKVVIETRVLSSKDVITISKILCKKKVGYIKSSTGLFERTNKRTNLQDLELIKKGCKIFGKIPRKYLFMYQSKIKISGGIRTKKDAEELINNGADLLGTSKIPKDNNEKEKEY